MKILMCVLVSLSSFLVNINADLQLTATKHQISAQALVNLDGKWVFKFETPRGERKYETVLKHTGNLAVGKIKGEPFKVEVKGDNVKFSTKRSLLIGTMVMNYKGTVKGDKMTGTYRVVKGLMASDKDYPWTAERIK